MSKRNQGRRARLRSYLDTCADVTQLIICPDLSHKSETPSDCQERLNNEDFTVTVDSNLKGTNQITLYF